MPLPRNLNSSESVQVSQFGLFLVLTKK